MGTDQQTDVCTCGHSRAAHFQLKSLACMKGDCICEAFDKVDPVRAAAPDLLEALEKIRNLERRNFREAWDMLQEVDRLAGAAIRKAKGE